MTAAPPRTWNDRLRRSCGESGIALCVGVDPAPDAAALVTTPPTSPLPAARPVRAAAIERFAGMVVESARDHAAAVKFQVAWFELAGVAGMRALERSVAYARGAGLLVVIDAKRGDVPHSAAAYADAWLGADAPSGWGGDALTVNAAIGRDSLAAMATIAADRSAGIYALVHTSNPGALELQGASTTTGAPWWTLLAADVDAASVGAVVGATHPDVVAHARDLMPRAPLLVPGIGAQGGRIADIAPCARVDAPVLVASSRSLLPDDPCDAAAFRAHVSSAAQQAAAALRESVAPAGLR